MKPTQAQSEAERLHLEIALSQKNLTYGDAFNFP